MGGGQLEEARGAPMSSHQMSSSLPSFDRASWIYFRGRLFRGIVQYHQQGDLTKAKPLGICLSLRRKVYCVKTLVRVSPWQGRSRTEAAVPLAWVNYNNTNRGT